MDYERIEKPPQGGGFSPRKLRTMLLAVEQKRKEKEELDSRFSLQSESEAAEVEDRRGNAFDDFKDVGMVSSLPECPTSAKDHNLAISRVRSQEEDTSDSESISSAFELHRAVRAPHRSALMPPFSKPAPSKWDDAKKWIASPTPNKPSKASGVQPKKTRMLGYGSQQIATKVVLEVTEEVCIKRIDQSQIKREIGEQKATNWVKDPYPVADSCAKPALTVENLVADSAISLSRHDSSTTVKSATIFITPPSTVRSVPMRDMGTEMTPIASEEPSQTGTPIRAMTPLHSPSRPSTPQRGAPSSTPTESADCHRAHNEKELSEKELQMKIRREIMMLGTQLGKMNIAAWASQEAEEKDASTSLKTVPMDQLATSVIQTHAATWEEAEKAKYQARFKQEETKVQAWVNHQKAKTEAEMRKIEVEVERMRGSAHDRLMNKLAASRHKAEEKRAAAEAKRNKQAARSAQQVEYISRTGCFPSSFFC